MSVKSFRGSRTPFAGWTAPDERPEQTDAVVTDQPANDAWGITAWILDDETTPLRKAADPVRILQWEDARNWKLYLPLGRAGLLVSRRGDTILVESQKSMASKRIQGILQPPPAEVAGQISQLHERFKTAAIRYPRMRDLFLYRVRASILGGVILILQEAFFFFYRRAGWRYLMALRELSFVGWIALGIWVVRFYLTSSS